MDKVTKQRNPKRQAAGRKRYEKYMAKLKEDILKNGGSSSSNSTNGGISTTNDNTTATSSTITNYIHGVGAIAVLSLGVCIFIIPKLMRNPSQPDKDPEKISKIRRKMLKPRRSNKRRASHYRSNSWNFWLLKMGKIASPPKAALDASNIIKLSRGVITGALLKDYAVCKKWI